MDASYVQSSFLGGEISKAYQGRFDLPTYRTSLTLCLNGYPIEQGAWGRRPGSRLLAVTRGGAAGRVLPFHFKASAPYEMELTGGFLRFFTGAGLVMTNDAVAVSSITTASPAVVNTAAAHGWATGDTVYFTNLGPTCPLLQNRPCKITVTGASAYSIADAVTGAAIDGSTLGVTLLSGSAQATRVLEIATAYTDAFWPTLRSVRADVPTANGTTPGAVLLQGDVKPYVLTVNGLPTSATFATFTLAAASFKDGPYFDPVPGGTLATPSAKVGVINLTLSFGAYDATRAYSIGDYVTYSSVNYKSLTDANAAHQPDISPTNWVAVASSDPIGPNGFTGSDIGRHVRLYSEPAIWAAGTTYAAGDVVAYGGSGLAYTPATYWRSLAGGNLANVPGVDLTKWVLFPTGAIWTWGKITALLAEIDRALAGSLNIGDLTAGGGLAAAFDGITAQTSATAADKSFSVGGSTSLGIQRGYVGKNYSGASAQAVASATLFPASNVFVAGSQVYVSADGSGTNSRSLGFSVVVNLRAKATAPANSADGTLLGTVTVDGGNLAPISITSSNQATTWNYAWFELVTTVYGEASPISTSISETEAIAVAEVKFFGPPGTGTSNGCQVQIVGDALLYTTAIRTWRLGLYSDTTGWPTCGTYHEGRLWLSGVIGNRIDASKSNDIFNFAPTGADGTVAGNNAIDYKFNAPDVNTILWMEPDQLGIVCGTAAGEWLIQATALNAPLTPTTIQAHRSMLHKCANIEPRRTGLTLAVVQAYGRTLLEFYHDTYSGKFAAHNLALTAKHLTKSGIAEIAYQQELTPIIWARRTDGRLVGCTYKRETLVSSQPPEFAGWHQHTLGSGRTVESICTGGNADGSLDALTMVTTDANGTRHVEKLATQFEEDDDLTDAWLLDDAIVPTSTQASVVPATDAPYGGLTVNGLWPLNGKTVTVFAGGLDCGDFLVASGSIFMPFGDSISAGTGSGLFTAALVDTGISIVAGFTYTSRGQIVRPNAPQEAGTRNGPAFGKKRRTQRFAALLANSAGISFGTDFASMRPALFKSGGGISYTPLQTFSGVYWDSLTDDYSFDSMLAWQITRPYPAIVAAIGGMLHTQDQ